MAYQHSQIATNLLIILAIAAAIVVLSAGSEGIMSVWPAMMIIGVIAALFYSLNVTVTDNAICWSFGPGFWRKTIDINEIVDVRIITTRWYNGWGIRYSAEGWLYRVSGDKAVQVTLKSGEQVNIGTDDACNLLAAIKQSTGQ